MGRLRPSPATNYSYDDMSAGQTDPSLANFSISHDLTDILPLTKQAEQLNSGLKLMMTPVEARRAWMKDNGKLHGSGLPAVAVLRGIRPSTFVKTIQAYQAQGVPRGLRPPRRNEPGCCSGANYPTMAWNGFRPPSTTSPSTTCSPPCTPPELSTKALALDWNWSNYASYGAATLNDATVRNDSLFGGVAWHGLRRGQRRRADHGPQPVPEHRRVRHRALRRHPGSPTSRPRTCRTSSTTPGTGGQSVVKWSLAVDQNDGPHNGGCGTCTGLITVHNKPVTAAAARVDYTIEYYDHGAAHQVSSSQARTASIRRRTPTVPNVAWINPDGSKALIAYKRRHRVPADHRQLGAASRSPTTLPARTTRDVHLERHAGRHRRHELDRPGQPVTRACAWTFRSASKAADGTPVQVYTCNGTPSAQQWTVESNGNAAVARQVPGRGRRGGRRTAPLVQLYTCNGTGAPDLAGPVQRRNWSTRTSGPR